MLAVVAFGADTLKWHTDKETLDVDLTDVPLIPALERLAAQTGWHIYLEPAPGRTFTTKFTGLSRGEAMRVLMGDMNYAFVSQPDGQTKLFVFRTSREAATYQIVGKAKPAAAGPAVKPVPNQIVVRLKPGAKIEGIAAKLGAKVKARIGSLNAYLLEFDDSAQTDAGRQALSSDQDVASFESNYYVEPPPAGQQLNSAPIPPVQLALNPPPADGRVVVGLVDTAVQNASTGLQKFLLPQVSVAGDAVASTDPTHGTSMAETVLRAVQAASSGATTVQVLPVDVYGPSPTTTTFDVANGIVQAVNGGATIINLSLGGTGDSSFLHSVITDVTGRQIPVFGAAGNTPVTTPTYPAAYPEVISVTASAGQGTLADYANRGSFVDMIAPGNSIVYFNGQPWLVTGTSAASAFAAGLAAGVSDARHVSPVDAANAVKASMPFTPPPAAK
jgi:hypothetical protein